MDLKVIDNHPYLNNIDERYSKTLESIVSSFRIEGIVFAKEELANMVKRVEEDLRK